MEIENKYLSALCDRDIDKVKSAEENFKLYDERAKIKAGLRTAKTEEEKQKLQIRFDEITEQIKK